MFIVVLRNKIANLNMNFIQEAETIKQCRLASNMAILKKDVDGVSKYWLPDFVQVAGDGSHTVGKSRIVEDWKYMFAHSSPVFERVPFEIQISDSGDKAWEQGTWAYKNEKFRGNYSAMWRKIKGKWLTQCELYVSLN
jgi:ketosteroid isomerase-like protein